jgi:hypothetical protein
MRGKYLLKKIQEKVLRHKQVEIPIDSFDKETVEFLVNNLEKNFVVMEMFGVYGEHVLIITA